MQNDISVLRYGGSAGDIHITNLQEEELDKLLACIKSGAYYVIVKNGRLEAVPIWEKLPDPVEDEAMLPFWRKQSGEGFTKEFYDEYQHSPEIGISPSISISHLCGYNYSKENYQENARKLESYGFKCMRSQRGEDAKFWETWYLPGLCFAKGDLKDRISRDTINNTKGQLDQALRFLARNVSFGSLDVSSQRLAMALDD